MERSRTGRGTLGEVRETLGLVRGSSGGQEDPL